MKRIIRSFLILGAATAFVGLQAVPALALEAAAGHPSQGEFGATEIFEELCDGDCSGLPTAEPVSGEPFDFVFGGKVGIAGTDIRINSGGSVYVSGSIHSQTRLSLHAGRDITVIGSANLSGDEIILNVNEGGGKDGIDFNFPVFGPIVPPIRPGVDICACLRTISHLDFSVLDANDLNLEIVEGEVRIASVIAAEAAVGAPVGAPAEERLRWSISRDGDIYLDLSQVTDVYRLKIKAGKSIVIAEGGTLPVPEPGTALLLSLGLASLSYKRRKSR